MASFYLKEWIEYHRLVGVEHFYLFNNDSDDHSIEVLRPYVEDGIITLTDLDLFQRFAKKCVINRTNRATVLKKEIISKKV